MNEGVARVCKCVDLDENTVRNWGTMADLSRIKGLGGQWAELMWAAGVTSVQNLAAREIGPSRACAKLTRKSAAWLNCRGRSGLRGSLKKLENSSRCCRIVISCNFNDSTFGVYCGEWFFGAVDESS